jgi:hypothetical protein
MDTNQVKKRGRLILNQVLSQAPIEFQNRIKVGSVVSIYRVDDSFDYWRVSLLIDTRNVGFIDPSPKLELLRNGFRLSSDTSITTLPLDLTEMDKNVLLSQLSTFDKVHTELLDQPRLVSLGSPTKLAWQCQVSEPKTKDTRILYVTPGFVWEEQPRNSDAE